jgi:hypothetical protein
VALIREVFRIATSSLRHYKGRGCCPCNLRTSTHTEFRGVVRAKISPAQRITAPHYTASESVTTCGKRGQFEAVAWSPWLTVVPRSGSPGERVSVWWDCEEGRVDRRSCLSLFHREKRRSMPPFFLMRVSGKSVNHMPDTATSKVKAVYTVLFCWNSLGGGLDGIDDASPSRRIIGMLSAQGTRPWSWGRCCPCVGVEARNVYSLCQRVSTRARLKGDPTHAHYNCRNSGLRRILGSRQAWLQMRYIGPTQTLV